MTATLNDTVIALGRGIVKVLVSVFLGTGTGLVTFGGLARDNPRLWHDNNPPGEMFLAIGVGLLMTGASMAVAFAAPRFFPRRAEPVSKTVEEWAS